ncbi:hypothetical protein C0992_002954, partial [Termitomyces sp. T32_za158]
MEDRPRHPIGVIKRSIKKAWDAESDDVRLQIIEEVERSTPKAHVPASSSVRTPQDYA